jgi:hypothetical protein
MTKQAMKDLVYDGPLTGGIDFPKHAITGWKPGEVRSVSADLADELLARGEFREATSKKKNKEQE